VTRTDMAGMRSQAQWYERALRALVRFFQVPLTADPAEFALSGTVGGVLWLGGGVVVLLPSLLGGTQMTLPIGVVLLLAGVCFLWGALSIWVLDWVNGAPWLAHVTAGAGLVVLTSLVYLTGDQRSAGWPYFTWLAIYGCFFYNRRAAIGLMLLCLAAQAVGLLLHPSASLHDGYGWQLALVMLGYGTVGMAIINGKQLMSGLRRQAEAEAGTDGITGLANHRRMDRALQEQAARAHQATGNFTLAVIDVDHLKQITDVRGHDASDAALADIARAMKLMAGPRDVLGRTGGDEFTWLMPDTSPAEAKKRPFPMRFSAGICDSNVEIDPPALVRLAEGALYWCKVHGRNQTQIYDPAVIDVLSADERAEMLQRSQAMIGLRALARAIDAKDPATAEHSERVGLVAEALARTIGWDEPSALALRDAALVHDVGKIGIDDAVLRKPGRLTPAERAHVNSHAEISARIVEGVLSREQVDWIRTHHERADGGGDPLGLDATEIPVGGALLAIADAYDAMTAGRTYSARRDPGEALRECQSLAGRHFTYEAVAALERWLAALPESGPARDPVSARVI
jgi:HD-GYP domain-containing protein (c-di-GMP phosphodiesterase class II)